MVVLWQVFRAAGQLLVIPLPKCLPLLLSLPGRDPKAWRLAAESQCAHQLCWSDGGRKQNPARRAYGKRWSKLGSLCRTTSGQLFLQQKPGGHQGWGAAPRTRWPSCWTKPHLAGLSLPAHEGSQCYVTAPSFPSKKVKILPSQRLYSKWVLIMMHAGDGGQSHCSDTEDAASR